MSYTKPGVEVSQVVRTSTPVLTASDLNPVIVGQGYKWLSPDVLNDASYFATTYLHTASKAVTLGTHLGTSTTNVVANSIVVDLQLVADGTIKHLTSGTDFTYNAGTGTITIVSGLTTGTANIIVGVLYAASGI